MIVNIVHYELNGGVRGSALMVLCSCLIDGLPVFTENKRVRSSHVLQQNIFEATKDCALLLNTCLLHHFADIKTLNRYVRIDNEYQIFCLFYINTHFSWTVVIFELNRHGDERNGQERQRHRKPEG